MKTLKILFSIMLLTVLGSCKDFEDFQSDPNRTTEGDPGLLLTGIEVSNLREISQNAAMASRYLAQVDFYNDAQYYTWLRSGFGSYNNLRQVVKMEEEALKKGNINYLGIGKFFRAYIFLSLTNTFGDIPYSNALQATEDNFEPPYDSQSSIYAKILDDLDEANSILSIDNGVISGDIIYDGNIMKWRKAINALTLRVLISLSKKENNSGLDVKGRFNTIINNPTDYPIFESRDDDLAIQYLDQDGNRYPFFNDNDFKTSFYLDMLFVDTLKSLQDPRLFYFGEKEPNGSNLPDDDFDAYSGMDGSATLGDNAIRKSSGEGSIIDTRYWENPTVEPAIALGYTEVQFTIAEAAARGWISSNPEVHYNEGITSSMQFYGINQSDIDTYLAQPSVQYSAQTGIEQILTQKYLSFFLNSGWEPFYNQRRTGIPNFTTDGGGVGNDQMVPKRWMYPQGEINENNENLQEAITRQFPEGDTVNGEMWLIKD